MEKCWYRQLHWVINFLHNLQTRPLCKSPTAGAAGQCVWTPARVVLTLGRSWAPLVTAVRHEMTANSQDTGSVHRVQTVNSIKVRKWKKKKTCTFAFVFTFFWKLNGVSESQSKLYTRYQYLTLTQVWTQCLWWNILLVQSEPELLSLHHMWNQHEFHLQKVRLGIRGEGHLQLRHWIWLDLTGSDWVNTNINITISP